MADSMIRPGAQGFAMLTASQTEDRGMKALCIFVMLLLIMPLSGSADTEVDVAAVRGRIQIVTSFPDYKVKIVESFADLHVQVVESFPDKPGRWQVVESFPDYKIQFVDSFPDFTIKYVESFPGPQ